MEKIVLLSNNDIPFEPAQLIIHVPTIKEIAYIGEDAFFRGCQYLTFSKRSLEQKDKDDLKELTDFEILMTILRNKSLEIDKIKLSMEMVLTLLFPDYKIGFLPMSILLSKEDENHLIDKDNFESFRNIVSEMFCLDYIHGQTGANKYNPGGPQARAIVEKFRERERRLAKLKQQGKIEEQSVSVFYTYISILSVGLQKSKNDLFQYSVFQLIDQFRRYGMKTDYELYIQLKIAGAKDLEDIRNWKGPLDQPFT